MSYTREELRQPARIVSVFRGREDHGAETVTINLIGEGWGQSFGNLCLDDRAESSCFLQELCAIFDISDSERLVGQDVIALYSVGPSDRIEGLECPGTGKRFTIRGWALRHLPTIAALTPTERERKRLEKRVEELTRRLAEATADLSALPTYVDWEVEP